MPCPVFFARQTTGEMGDDIWTTVFFFCPVQLAGEQIGSQSTCRATNLVLIRGRGDGMLVVVWTGWGSWGVGGG